MVISSISEEDREIIGQCLACVASGEVIANDWEFATLFGIEFSTLREVADAWPNVSESDAGVLAAVTNSLGCLIGYPHGKDAVLRKYISVSPSDLGLVLERWRQSSGEVL
jgi:hypothetical protein